MYSIRVFRDIAAFNELAREWDGLLARCRRQPLFLTFDWLSVWLGVYLNRQPLLLLAVYREDKLVGLGPFYVQTRRHYGMVPLRELRILGSGEACPDHLDLLLDEGHAFEAAAAIWRYLWGPLTREWDVIRLDAMDAGSTALAIFRKQAGEEPRCAVAEIADITSCPYILLPNDAQTFMASLGSKTRYNVGKSRRMLEAKGNLHFEQCTRTDDLPRFMGTLVDLHQRAWQARGLPGSFASPSFRRFHELISERYFPKGQVGLFVLYLDETPLAATYGFDHRGVHYGYVMGMSTTVDPKVSMGHVVMAYMVEALTARGCREFDMLRGDEPYKYHWTSEERRDVTLQFFRSSNRSLFYLAVRSARKFARAVVKKMQSRPVDRTPTK
ncbi:MAG: GNAT family N-acetyltransferase [Candidatus Zixiibacteriota bacterium]